MTSCLAGKLTDVLKLDGGMRSFPQYSQLCICMCTYRDVQYDQFGNVSCASELYDYWSPQIYCILFIISSAHILPAFYSAECSLT